MREDRLVVTMMCVGLSPVFVPSICEYDMNCCKAREG